MGCQLGGNGQESRRACTLTTIAIHLQIDNKPALSYLLKMGVLTTEKSCTSARSFRINFTANKLRCLQSIFPVPSM